MRKNLDQCFVIIFEQEKLFQLIALIPGALCVVKPGIKPINHKNSIGVHSSLVMPRNLWKFEWSRKEIVRKVKDENGFRGSKSSNVNFASLLDTEKTKKKVI